MRADIRQCHVSPARNTPFLPGSADGLSVLPLHQGPQENVALVRWEKGTRFNRHRHWGGEEIMRKHPLRPRMQLFIGETFFSIMVRDRANDGAIYALDIMTRESSWPEALVRLKVLNEGGKHIIRRKDPL